MLTLVVVNAVSLSFQPDRLLSLCCVSTDTDWGFGFGFVPLAGATLSLQVASNRKTSDRGSLRLAMSDPQQVHCGTRMSIARTAWHRRAEVRCDRAAGELTSRPHGEQARNRVSRALGVFMLACLLYTSDAADDLLCVDL